MITQFTVRRIFCTTSMSITFELDAGLKPLVSYCLTYKGAITKSGDFSPAEVTLLDTPAKAEAWLSAEVGPHGSRIETLHATLHATHQREERS